jgi:hypothetical protein
MFAALADSFGSAMAAAESAAFRLHFRTLLICYTLEIGYD